MIDDDDLEVFRPLDPSFRKVDSGALRTAVNKIADGIEKKDTESEIADELDGGMIRVACEVNKEGCELAHALNCESDQKVALESARLIHQILVGAMARGVTLNDILSCLE